MTVYGKHGKTIKLFSHPSHKPWKSLRDSHIPSALRLIIFTQFSNQKKEPSTTAYSSHLQAHLSIGKDFPRASGKLSVRRLRFTILRRSGCDGNGGVGCLIDGFPVA
jgi:hypothetical protein